MARSLREKGLFGLSKGWGIEVTGLDQVVDMLDALTDGVADLSPAWAKVGEWYGKRQRDIFGRGGAGGGARGWAPNKADYLVRKRRDGFAGQGPLVRTGQLRRAATDTAPLKSSRQFVVLGLSRASAPSVMQRAQWLSKGRRSMPRRSAVPRLTAGERADITRIVGQSLAETMREARR